MSGNWWKPVVGGSADNQAPTAPAALTATATSSSAINLSWNASTDNVGVTGYTIFRGGTQIGTATGLSYADSGLTASTAYSYTVKAVDGAGNLSGNSNTANATTLSSSPVGANLALNKPATSSSTEGTGFEASKAFDGSSSTRWASVEGVDPQWIYVNLGSSQSVNKVKLNWEAAFASGYTVQLSNDSGTPANWTTVFSTTTGNGAIDEITFPAQNAKYVRVNGTTRGTAYGYSLWDFEVFGAPTSVANLAAGKTTTTSSIEGTGFEGNKAVDGNVATRWASVEGVDPQWIYVNLNTSQFINRVKLTWEAAYATAYTVQVSNDTGSPTNWTTVYSTTTGNGAVDDLTLSAVNAKYVRVHATARATAYGYSLFEFEVYGV
ncbi:discoidin domain-containing protein [Paenibacillus sp. GSMTC-2017]|uniref:discoidin domain-containing protein n=1 Tax=Paenibacillus sp. GSMTC-2017 TaxID=2794350 RepID=UPI001E3AE209|nr:discoidin domain-containing protein [Paenibacillus sp. GSMTC-2017]